jgi:23S rRNA (pseudouridine1915-N3)-methyltransferase
MKISCVCIGETSDKEFKVIQKEYLNRLSHYTTFEMIEIPNIKKAKNLSEDQLKVKESELFEKYIKPSDNVILLDNHGKTFTSEKYAEQLEQWRFQGANLVFLIGGAYGFAPNIVQRANQKISLSPMTFTHQMVRMIFLEQLYRAHTILKGEKYHH